MRESRSLPASAQHLLAIALIAATGLYMFRWVRDPAMTWYMDDWTWLQPTIFFDWNAYKTIWTVLPAALFHDRPMEYFTWKALYDAFGLSRTGYAVVILTIHIANCLLLYWLGVKLVGSRFWAMVAALFFAINYLVAAPGWWPSIVSDSESLFFCLCAFLAFLSPNRWLSTVGTVVFYWLAIKSKEVAMPFAALLLTYDFLGRVRSARLTDLGSALWGTLRHAWPLLCTFIMFFGFAIYYYVQAKSGDMAATHGPYAPRLDMGIFVEGVRIYLWHIAIQLVSHDAALALYALLAVAAIATFDRVAIVGVLGFFIGTGPVLFLANQRVEYYAYAACAYLALAVVALMRRADIWIAPRIGGAPVLAGRAVLIVAMAWLAHHVYAKAYYREWILDRMREATRAIETLRTSVPNVVEQHKIVVTGAQSGPNLFSSGPCLSIGVLYKVWQIDCRIDGTDNELTAHYAQLPGPKMLLQYHPGGAVTLVSSSP